MPESRALVLHLWLTRSSATATASAAAAMWCGRDSAVRLERCEAGGLPQCKACPDTLIKASAPSRGESLAAVRNQSGVGSPPRDCHPSLRRCRAHLAGTGAARERARARATQPPRQPAPPLAPPSRHRAGSKLAQKSWRARLYPAARQRHIGVKTSRRQESSRGQKSSGHQYSMIPRRPLHTRSLHVTVCPPRVAPCAP